MSTQNRIISSAFRIVIILAVCAGSISAVASDHYPSTCVRSKAEQRIEVALNQPVRGFEFVDVPLVDQTQFMKESLGFPVMLDELALREAGLDVSTPITADLRDLSLRSALHLMLTPLGLTFAIRDDVLLITAPHHPHAFEIRCYNVSPLMQKGMSGEELTMAISQLVGSAFNAGSGWREPGLNSAEPLARVVALREVLIVRETERGHERVGRILKSLLQSFGADDRQEIGGKTLE